VQRRVSRGVGAPDVVHLAAVEVVRPQPVLVGHQLRDRRLARVGRAADPEHVRQRPLELVVVGSHQPSLPSRDPDGSIAWPRIGGRIGKQQG